MVYKELPPGCGNCYLKAQRLDDDTVPTCAFHDDPERYWEHDSPEFTFTQMANFLASATNEKGGDNTVSGDFLREWVAGDTTLELLAGRTGWMLSMFELAYRWKTKKDGMRPTIV